MSAVLSDNRANTNINLRTSAAKKALIAEAAEVLGQNLTKFMLDTLCEKAHEVLANRTEFHLSKEKFAVFNRLLDAPVNEAVWRMLARRAPWET